MPLELVALPPELVTIDESRYPDGDKTWVYDHLMHYCSLFDPLPAIRILINENGPVVTWGHKYLRISRALRRPLIRALIKPGSNEDAKASLLQRADVVKLDWEEIDAIERATPVIDQWHVFYFERALSAREKRRFDDEVAAFFVAAPRPAWDEADTIVGQVQHDDSEHRAQFRARTPVADESWYRDFLAAVNRFSRNVAKIISYQGRRFVG
jgi:hypothetical protein